MDETKVIVEQLTSTVSYLRVATDDDDNDNDNDGTDWLACEPLVSSPSDLLELVRSTAKGRGTDQDQVAMSLFVQGYAFRIASVAIGSWLVADRVIDLAPATMAIAIGRDRPNAVRLYEPKCVDDDADLVAAVHRSVIDDHLALLVDNAHAACRVGAALLWGNVAASCAVAFGAFMDPLPDRQLEIRDRLSAFMAAGRPELQAGGAVVPVGGRWVWQRSACCLWYQTESAFKCDDCSLWSAEERQARVDRVLAEQETPA